MSCIALRGLTYFVFQLLEKPLERAIDGYMSLIGVLLMVTSDLGMGKGIDTYARFDRNSSIPELEPDPHM